MSSLIIIGAGGFGLEVAAYAEDIIRSDKAALTIKGFLDDTKPVNTRHAGYPVLGPTDSKVEPGFLYVVAIGSPEARKALAEAFAAKGAQFASILHPSSYVAASARVGEGTIIAPFAFAGPEARIGNHCILNVHASAGHESVIGDYSVLSPYADIHGSVVLGNGVFMGSHASVTAKIHVEDGAKIAAGSIVYSNIPTGLTAIGNPAAFRKTG